MSATRPPKLRRQLGHRLKDGRRSSTRWFVELRGRRHHLGSGGTGKTPPPDIERAYHRLLAEWFSAGERMPAPRDEITIDELVLDYLQHAKTYYRKDGKPTSSLGNIKGAVRVLVRLYGDMLVSEFGPLRLKAVRDEMVRLGWCRTTVNNRVSSIKRVFRWGTENERIPPGVSGPLLEVESLAKGRTEAPDLPPKRALTREQIHRVRALLPRAICALIDLQFLTGARSGELVALRAVDIDRSGEDWEAEIKGHKTEHRGQRRHLQFNAEAQTIIQQFIADRPEDAYLFSPRDAYRERRSGAKSKRRPNQKPTPRQTPRRMGEHYTTHSYRAAIRRACEKAFPHPTLEGRELTAEQQAELNEWRRTHRWTPHQLRRTALTEIEREHGLEEARAVAGHTTIRMTDHYVEKDRRRAVEAVRSRSIA